MRHALSLLLLAASLAAGSTAQAAEDAPVTTRPSQTVAEQIDAYLKSPPPLDAKDIAPVDGLILTRPDRRPHGVVSASVGTGGYRSIYARSDMPVGKTGTLSIAVQDSRSKRDFAGPYGYGGGYRSLSAGFALGEDARPMGERRRCSPYAESLAEDLASGPECRRAFRPAPYGAC